MASSELQKSNVFALCLKNAVFFLSFPKVFFFFSKKGPSERGTVDNHSYMVTLCASCQCSKANRWQLRSCNTPTSLNIQYLSHMCWHKAPIYVAVFSLCLTEEALKRLGGTSARGWAAGVSSQGSLCFCTLAKYGLIFFFFLLPLKEHKTKPMLCLTFYFQLSKQDR